MHVFWATESKILRTGEFFSYFIQENEVIIALL